MSVSRSLLRIVAVVTVSMVIAISAPTPARAASWGPTNIYATNGTLIGTASWTDSTDTLCVTERVTWTVYVHLWSTRSGDPEFIWTIPGSRNSQWCSGNLSIPEDVQYKFSLSNNQTIRSSPKYFYT